MHKRINEVQSYLMGDIGEVNPDDILREIKKELKKKGSQQGRDYLVEIFFKYNNLKIQFEKPSFIFDKPKMHYLSMRWQHSIVSEKDYLRNRENALTPHPPKVDSNSYVLTDRKYSNKPIPSDTRLAKVNLRLQQFKPNETDKLVTGEDIKMYKKFTSLSEKERNHKLLVLDSIINRILVIVNENKLIPKYRGIVLKHIRINESWNKNKLGLLYDKLVSNRYIEKGKKDLFINFFYVNNEVILELNQNIKWLRSQTRGSAYPCIEFLLIGLKDINKLQDSVIKFSSLQLIRKQLLELKKEYEYNKDLTKGLTTRESEETLLKAKQEYESSKLKYDEIFVSLPSHPNDRERILELFVDRNNNIITKDKLRIRPEFDNYALDMYNIMTSVLNEEKAKK